MKHLFLPELSKEAFADRLLKIDKMIEKGIPVKEAFEKMGFFTSEDDEENEEDEEIYPRIA